MEKYERKTSLWLYIKHFFTGHPKKDCKDFGYLTVRCKCGSYISLVDYY